ncbi:MAG: hypothetical protein FWB96_02245 [Defluviitaleaceae bacterium]|nr:hypothetical protein [Defluviitaleaceae bacterium]MCL2262358.1 hypothetical protein [Defluviitaleaceae bacterium]
MKIGDYVTTEQILNQSECRWVVLTDLTYGEYIGAEGGIIRFIGDNEEAGNAAAEIELGGTDTLLVGGTEKQLCVGDIFID